jgi:myosin heavy subunit|eukprot:COSAG01_NODE_1535_length_9988_cov_30.249065_2_plen_111_part_00
MCVAAWLLHRDIAFIAHMTLLQEFTGQADSGNFMPMDPSNLSPADDMVSMGDLHEAALLHNLRIRFMADEIFTYIGPILIACNPYKILPIFTPAVISVRALFILCACARV